MKLIVEKVRSKLDNIRITIVDDNRRRAVIFVWFNMILWFVSGFMTVVNIFTSKWLLMAATLIFSIACLFNVALHHKGGLCRRASVYLFLTESMILCGFFCISGTPEGFSALWTCFIPSFAIALLGSRRGNIYSGVGFLMVTFIFWTPVGRSLLQYDYTDSFMLRFPMIYFAFFLMAIFLETVRSMTLNQLIKAEQRYQHLYKHDALTGIYNRYGFNERFDVIFSTPDIGELALFMVDIDLFKNINDTYGHDVGDVALKFVADTLRQSVGQNSAVCRWGGEEFTVLTWDEPEPEARAERIRREFENARFIAGGEKIQITVSIGVCVVSDRETVTIAQMVKSADKCLYAVKEAGRNQVASIRL